MHSAKIVAFSSVEDSAPMSPDHAPRSSKKIFLAPTGASTHVHDDNVARLEDGHELLLDIGAEALAIDRPVEDAGCGNRNAVRQGMLACASDHAAQRRASACPSAPAA